MFVLLSRSLPFDCVSFLIHFPFPVLTVITQAYDIDAYMRPTYTVCLREKGGGSLYISFYFCCQFLFSCCVSLPFSLTSRCPWLYILRHFSLQPTRSVPAPYHFPNLLWNAFTYLLREYSNTPSLM